MPISEEKQRVVGYIDKDVGKEIARIAREIGVSESNIVCACIECGLDQYHFFEFLGLTPRRMGVIRRLIERWEEKKSKRTGTLRDGARA